MQMLFSKVVVIAPFNSTLYKDRVTLMFWMQVSGGELTGHLSSRFPHSDAG